MISEYQIENAAAFIARYEDYKKDAEKAYSIATNAGAERLASIVKSEIDYLTKQIKELEIHVK